MILIQSEIKAAIIFRIWKNSLTRRTRFAIRVIAESGVLYTLTSIAAFATNMFPNTNGSTSDNAYAMVSAIVCHQ